MARKKQTRYVAAVRRFFERADQRVFSSTDLRRVFSSNRGAWRVPSSMTFSRFLDFLASQEEFRAVEFGFPNRRTLRYTWREQRLLATVRTLRPRAYFSHYTAMYLHGLTLQVPNQVYLNAEQSAKPRGGELTQHGIDVAFSSRPRETKNRAVVGNTTVCLLNGKQTGRLGVVPLRTPEGAEVETTTVERTLVDIVVRPWYSGGLQEVLEAYRAARDLVSVNALVGMLGQLDYVYPYHQAIGFCLEKVGGYDAQMVGLLRELDMDFDFYLAHRIEDKAYSESWRLYYPKGL